VYAASPGRRSSICWTAAVAPAGSPSWVSASVSTPYASELWLLAAIAAVASARAVAKSCRALASAPSATCASALPSGRRVSDSFAAPSAFG
jgi:hypothetical protein